MMIRRVGIVGFAIVLAVAAAGQEGPRGDAGGAGGWGGPAGRGGGWGGPGGPGGGPGRGWGPGAWLGQMVERLDQELVFDEEQRAQVGLIVAAQEERMQTMRAQWQEVRDGMEAGDEARAAELREQLRAQGGGPGRGMEEMFGQIEAVLREDQLVTFRQMQTRMQEMRERGREMWQTVRELPDAVGMTDEQRVAYDALLRERWQAMREQMRQRWEQGADAGPWEPPDWAALEDEFYGQVAGMLNEGQQQLLSDYRGQVGGEALPVERQAVDDLRKVLQAMKRIRGLSTEQRESLREIERSAQRSYADVRRDQERAAQLAADVKAQIIKVLDPTQAEGFQRMVERLHGRSGPGERRPPRDREPQAP